MEMTDVDFERKIFVKQHAADLLRHELKKVKKARRSPSAPPPILTNPPNDATRSPAPFSKSSRAIEDSNLHGYKGEPGRA